MHFTCHGRGLISKTSVYSKVSSFFLTCPRVQVFQSQSWRLNLDLRFEFLSEAGPAGHIQLESEPDLHSHYSICQCH